MKDFLIFFLSNVCLHFESRQPIDTWFAGIHNKQQFMSSIGYILSLVILLSADPTSWVAQYICKH